MGQGKVKVTVNGLDLPGETLAPFTREWTLGVRPAYPALLKHYRAVLNDQPWSLPEGELQASEKLMQAALHWAQQQQLATLRVATQLGNTAALKRYILSGANVESTAYWLYR